MLNEWKHVLHFQLLDLHKKKLLRQKRQFWFVCFKAALGIQSLSRLAGTYSTEQTLLSLGTDCHHADSHSSSQCGCGNGTLKGFLKPGTMSHVNHTQAGIAIKNMFRICHKSSKDWINVGYQFGYIYSCWRWWLFGCFYCDGKGFYSG